MKSEDMRGDLCGAGSDHVPRGHHLLVSCQVHGFAAAEHGIYKSVSAASLLLLLLKQPGRRRNDRVLTDTTTTTVTFTTTTTVTGTTTTTASVTTTTTVTDTTTTTVTATTTTIETETTTTNAKATTKLRSERGEIYTDFDMALERSKTNVKKESGEYEVSINSWVYGKINGGGPEFTFKNMHGSIIVRKGN